MAYNYVVFDEIDGKFYYKGTNFDEAMDVLAECMAYYESAGTIAMFRVNMCPIVIKEVQNV